VCGKPATTFTIAPVARVCAQHASLPLVDIIDALRSRGIDTHDRLPVLPW